MSDPADVTRRRVEFDLPEHLVDEALLLEDEMGSPLEVIALSALEGYIQGVRDARLMEDSLNVAALPHTDEYTVLEGTEPWLDAHRDD